MNVEDLIQIKIEEAARKIAAARRDRVTRQEARRRGLAHRHASKLRHLALTAPDSQDAAGTPPAETPDDRPPSCAA